MADLNGSKSDNLAELKRLTMELAEEIEYDEYGQAFKYIRLLFDNVQSSITIIDRNCKFLYINPAAIKSSKELAKIDVVEGDHCMKLLQNDPKFCEGCLVKKVMKERRVMNERFISPNTNIEYWRTCIPLAFDGVSGVIHILERYHG